MRFTHARTERAAGRVMPVLGPLCGDCPGGELECSKRREFFGTCLAGAGLRGGGELLDFGPCGGIKFPFDRLRWEATQKTALSKGKITTVGGENPRNVSLSLSSAKMKGKEKSANCVCAGIAGGACRAGLPHTVPGCRRRRGGRGFLALRPVQFRIGRFRSNSP